MYGVFSTSLEATTAFRAPLVMFSIEDDFPILERPEADWTDECTITTADTAVLDVRDDRS